MRRFYKSVDVSDDNRILLDGRPVKTPLKAALKLPSRALASAVAQEWSDQTDRIDPHAMPLTKLANTALDRAITERDQILQEIADYAGSDLTFYRAEIPASLVQLQSRMWDPVIAWANERYQANFAAVPGVMHKLQDKGSLRNFSQAIAELDPFHLVTSHFLMTLIGSALISAMVMEQSGF